MDLGPVYLYEPKNWEEAFFRAALIFVYEVSKRPRYYPDLIGIDLPESARFSANVDEQNKIITVKRTR